MAPWGFLTNHAGALLYIAHDPETRLRDLAVALDITERTAYGIVADLAEAGYVVKEKEGRRNRYRIEGDLPPVRQPLPLPERNEPGEEPGGTKATIGELLDLLARAKRPPNPRPKGQ
jgi:DNA-binding transcriptional ArsR family regulator